MKVTNKLISDLAELAKLRFNKSENEKMKSDFKNMLDFIDKLSEVNTKNIGSKMKKHGALQLRKMKMVIFKLH